tara:strand:+ start:378 stop:797 length:420 start_codon:yes stop_codon:yes gene_type:complete
MLDGGASIQVKTFKGLEIGRWYGVKGHEASGVKLPNQYIFIVSKSLRKEFWELDSFTCHHYMVMFGQLWPKENHVMSCPEVGIGVGDHGINDIHLEKMNIDTVAQELAHATGQYKEIQEERVVKGMKNTSAEMHKEIYG